MFAFLSLEGIVAPMENKDSLDAPRVKIHRSYKNIVSSIWSDRE